MKALLDTHSLLWWHSAEGRLSPAQERVIEQADLARPLLISEISLWEVATLYGLGQIELDVPLRDWLEKAIAPPLIRRLGITPAVAAEVAMLPDSFHRDPADRILVATARVHVATLLTRDRRIIEADLVPVIA